MPKFEWDNNKNQYQETRDSGRRYKIIGKAFEAIITVIYTMRDLIVRITSARRSSKDERKAYLTNKLSKKAKDDE